MRSKKESAATRQSHRANSNPAMRRKPRPSVSQLERSREIAVNVALAVVIVGLALGVVYGAGIAYEAGYQAALSAR